MFFLPISFVGEFKNRAKGEEEKRGGRQRKGKSFFFYGGGVYFKALPRAEEKLGKPGILAF